MTGKNRSIAVAWMVVLGASGLSSPALTQEPAEEVGREAVAPESQHQASRNQVDIAHHIGNASEVETPFGVLHLPTNWKIPLGRDAHDQHQYLDLSPPHHLVYMLLAAILITVIIIPSALILPRQQSRGQPPKRFTRAIDAM